MIFEQFISSSASNDKFVISLPVAFILQDKLIGCEIGRSGPYIDLTVMYERSESVVL